MKVFDKHLIEELETELLNQYLNISWLADYLDDGFQELKLDMFCDEPDSKNRSLPITVKDLLKALIDINVNIARKESLDSHLHPSQVLLWKSVIAFIRKWSRIVRKHGMRLLGNSMAIQ